MNPMIKETNEQQERILKIQQESSRLLDEINSIMKRLYTPKD